MEIEYMTIDKKYKDKQSFIQELNDLGRNGWSVVSVNETSPEKFGGDWKISALLSKQIKTEKQILNS